MSATETLQTLQGLTEIVEKSLREPFGPPANPELRSLAGQACVRLCDGDPDRARALWRLIAADLGGYMPSAAASALLRASDTSNLVADVEAPAVA